MEEGQVRWERRFWGGGGGGRDSPLAAKKVPAYCTCTFGDASSMTKPTMAMSSNAIMARPRWRSLSVA